MSNRDFGSANKRAQMDGYRHRHFDFHNRESEPKGPHCTGDANCVVDTIHKPGCPKLAADLERMRAKR